MLTPTSPLGLPQFESGDDFNYTDVNSAMQRVNDLTIPTTCTAATRPTTDLFAGRTIYQTDTGEFFTWDGDEWREYARDDQFTTTVANTAARPATNLYVGREIYQTDEGHFFKWDGAKWQVASTNPSQPAVLTPTDFSKSNDSCVVVPHPTIANLVQVDLRATFQRTGAGLALSNSGHTVIGTVVPTAARVTQVLRMPVLVDIGAGFVICSGYISTAGELRLKAPSSSTTIATNDSIQLLVSYAGVTA